MHHDIWLVGSGLMSQDYIKVLKGLKKDFVVIGRSEEKARLCKDTTGCSILSGGLEKFLATKPRICTYAIVSVGVESLYIVAKQLLEYGVKNILLEKPGCLYSWQLKELQKITKDNRANVVIGYNRRFYASVLKALDIIKKDGGVISFNFEFTEWPNVIESLAKPKNIKERWFLGNSTHVADLAFYLGGKPKEIKCFTEGGLSWHPDASIFSGAGVSESNALFSYHANWESAGRWSVEILTKEHKLIFRPIEKLQLQKRGEITQDFCNCVDYALDEEYKPGLFLQTKNFLNNNFEDMCTIDYQVDMMDTYNKMSNYGE